MSRLVLDASVALCWLFEDQATAYTDSVLDRLVGGDDVVVPTISALRDRNVVAVAERRKLVNAAQAVAFLQTLGQLSIALDRTKIQDVFSLVFEAAQRYRLSAYDASYLELAMREALPLATGDGALRMPRAPLGFDWPEVAPALTRNLAGRRHAPCFRVSPAQSHSCYNRCRWLATRRDRCRASYGWSRVPRTRRAGLRDANLRAERRGRCRGRAGAP